MASVTHAVEASPKSVGSSVPQQIADKLIFLTTQMHVGVQIFFVISGYCIAASAESLRNSERSMSDYFRRRFTRIFPTYWCALILTAGACWLVESQSPGLLKGVPWPLTMPWDLSVAQVIGSMTLTATWLGYVVGAPPTWRPIESCFPIQSWTLCYEEQFYAVIGLLLFVSRRRGTFFRCALALTLLVAVVDCFAMVYGFPIRGLFFDEHWFMFAAGLGTYWRLNVATNRQGRVFELAIIVSIVMLSVLGRTTSLFGPGSPFSAWRVVSALGFTLLLLWLKKYDATIANWRWLGWLQACGTMSYSIYLIHVIPGKIVSQKLLAAGYSDSLATMLICVPCVLAVSLVSGSLFFIAIERRFLKWQQPSLSAARSA